MKEKYLQIINHFRIYNQLRKFNEEQYELIDSIRDYEEKRWYGANDELLIPERNHIIEELADVLNLVNQFKEYYGISDAKLNRALEYKVDRTIERIECGYYDC